MDTEIKLGKSLIPAGKKCLLPTHTHALRWRLSGPRLKVSEASRSKLGRWTKAVSFVLKWELYPSVVLYNCVHYKLWRCLLDRQAFTLWKHQYKGASFGFEAFYDLLLLYDRLSEDIMHFIPAEEFPSHAWVSFRAPFRLRCRGNEFMLTRSCAEASCQSGFKICVQRHLEIKCTVKHWRITRRSPINTPASIKAINKVQGTEPQVATPFGRALVLGSPSPALHYQTNI